MDLHVDAGDDVIELEIFAESNPSKCVNKLKGFGLQHLVFQADDVKGVVAKLAQKELECEPIRLVCYTHKKRNFFDSDGLLLELHE